MTRPRTLRRIVAAFLAMFGPCAGGGSAFGEAHYGALPQILTADAPSRLHRVARSGFGGLQLPEVDALAGAIRVAAQSAREAGDDGILLDLRWDAPCWVWTAGADSAAQRLGRTAQTGYPDGAIACLIGADILDAGTPGLSFLTGLLDGPPSTNRGQVHLLLAYDDGATLETMLTAFRRARAVLKLHASHEGAARLRLGCWLPATAVAADPAAFRARLAAAQLVSHTYIYIDTAVDALAERGHERRTPLEGMVRAGEITIHGVPAFALRTPSGAGLVPMGPMASIAVERSEPLTVIHLGAGEPATHEVGDDGHIDLPALPAPTLIDGFTMNEILPQAALFANAPPWDPADSRHAIEFGVVNETGLRIDGIVQCIAPLGYAVTPADLPISLEPGERTVARAHLAGQPIPGDGVSLRLVLSMPGVQPAARTVDVYVLPKEAWRAENPAPLVAGPRKAGQSPNLLLWTHAAHGLAAVSSDGALQWESEIAAPIGLPPAFGTQWHGLPLYAVAGADGFLHTFDPGGKPLWRWAADQPAPSAAITSASLHASPGTEWAVADADGVLHVLSAQGALLWSARLGAMPAQIAVMPAQIAVMPGADGFDVLAIALGGADPRILTLGHGGATHWTYSLRGPPHAAPVVASQGLLVPDGDALAILDPANGEPVGAIPAVAGPLLAAVPIPGADGADSVLLASSAHVERRAMDGAPLWSVLIGTASPPVLCPTDAGLYIAVAGLDDVLYLLDDDGGVLWEDRRAAHALVGAPCFVESDVAGPLVVQASRDGFVRAIRLGTAPLANRAARP